MVNAVNGPVGYLEDTEEMVRGVGDRIRTLRGRRSLTLLQVSERTGVSVSMLSMLERGVANPSIGTLVAVSSALGIQMSELFETEDDAERNPVHLFEDQVVVEAAEGVTRRLVHNDFDRGLEVVVNEYEPSSASAGERLHHDGKEYGVVLSGTLTVELGDSIYTLNEGDGISYSSRVPHRFVNKSTKRVRTMWFNVVLGRSTGTQGPPGRRNRASGK